MLSKNHAHLDELSQSPEYQAKLRYRTAPRPATAFRTLGVGQLGHLLETLKDAMLLAHHLASEPHVDPDQDQVYRMVDPTTIPSYLRAVASPPLQAPTFHRTDTGRILEAKSAPDLSALLNEVHGLLRQQGLALGKTWVIPDAAQGLVAQYDDMVRRYKELLAAHRHPTSGRIDFHCVPPEAMDRFNAEFGTLADRVEATLTALPTCEIESQGVRYSLPNTQLLNDRLRKSYPALVLFAFRTVGLGLADHNKRPAAAEYEARQRDLVGAQSMITDTTQGLFDLARRHGCTFANLQLESARIESICRNYVRSLQLLRAFCRTARCGYQRMFADFDLLLAMSGASTDLRLVKTPQEAALLVYAIERRLAREGLAAALQAPLRRFADLAAQCRDLREVSLRFGQDESTSALFRQVHEMIVRADLNHVLEAFRLLKAIPLFFETDRCQAAS